MLNICLLYIHRQSFVSLGQILLPPIPCSFPPLPQPLSPVLVSYFLPIVLLRETNLLCAKNFTLEYLELITAPNNSDQGENQILLFSIKGMFVTESKTERVRDPCGNSILCCTMKLKDSGVLVNRNIKDCVWVIAKV